MDCGQCGIDNPSGARFCMQCGAPLAARSTDPGPAPDDQRRQVTAMFCDLVGYTEIGQKLDPEELRALVAEFQRCCVSIVESHGGYVAQYLGDGVLVYFGYPVANEDDAVRAVRSALELRSALEERNAQGRSRGGPPLEARIGVHTGPVVISHVGSGSRREALAVGDTVNLAARLQSVAPPGGIAISNATRRLVAGLFVTRDLGVHSLKGIAEGQQVHEVERASGVRHRFEAAGTLTPLVGRDRELGLLLDRWEKTCAGVGQVVLLSSDPGVGKSRVIHAFREKLRDESHTAIDGYCSQYTTGTAFHPITQLIEIGLGFEEDDSPHARLEKLEGAFALPNLSAADLVPFLGPLLGVPASKLYPTPELSPERRRERTLEALVAMLRSLAVLQPLLVVFEDLHWSDPSTLEALGRLIEEAPNARLMLLLTFRPSFEPPWNLAQRGASSLSLARLGRAETIALAESVAGGSKLPEDVLEQVLARADGVPLFVEELVRSVLDGGKLVERSGQWTAVGSTTEIEVPVSLQDSLMARLDRLSSAKNVAQICAALGREFPYELLESVAGLTPETLSAGLDQLVEADVLLQSGSPPAASYSFKHSLLQDTAYQSLLRSTRESIHARIAQALEERQEQGAVSEATARHYKEGGLAKQAARHYLRSGDRALDRFATLEAIDAYERAVSYAESSGAAPRELADMHARLGRALAGAGRRAEAAQRYLQAARAPGAENATAMLREAAYNLLRSGRIDEGVDTLRTVAREAGVRMSRSRLLVFLELIWLRVRLSRSRYEIPARTGLDDRSREKLDLYFDLNIGLRTVQPFASALFSSRHTLLALRSGEPSATARALALEAGTNAVDGTRRGPVADELIARAREIAEQQRDPGLSAFVDLLAGNVAFQAGDWQATRRLCERAESILEEIGAAGGEFDVLTLQLSLALWNLGDLDALAERIRRGLADAARRGDIYGARLRLGVCANATLLRSDDPEAVRHDIRQALGEFRLTGFQIPHLEAAMAETERLLYIGQGEEALAFLREKWSGINRTFLSMSQIGAGIQYELRGRCEVAAATAAARAGRAPSLAGARHFARRTEKTAAPWAVAVAALIRAGITSLESGAEAAREPLDAVVKRLEEAGMNLHASAARYRIAGLQGGTAPDELESDLRARGIPNCERMAGMLAPGLWTPRGA
jgi:class 3 adenylate cyclase/tetratricopeptide (TPR) repeat protein